MNYCKLKNDRLLCFAKSELLRLFKIAKQAEIRQEMIKKNLSFDDLRNDYSKMKKVAKEIGERGARDRDEHEIFAALFSFIDFYEDGSEICFKLKTDFDINKNKITSLQDLNKFRDDPPDFIIRSSDGLREFELKRYRDKLGTEEIFEFLKKKVAHYGNNLGDVNLLLVLQPPAYSLSNIDFQELHTKLRSLNLKFQGQILISYNENNKEDVINQVYPDLTTTRIPLRLPSAKLNHENYSAN